jgi:hypothetical protein
MLDHARLQLSGPVSVVGTILSAQICAHALAMWPTSSLAWYLNLQAFKPFRYGIDCVAAEQWLGSDGLSQSGWVAVLLVTLLGAGLLLRSRLAIALACHLGLLYSALVVFANGDPLADARGSWEPWNYLGLAVLLSSTLSSTASHRGYWREIKSCWQGPRRPFRHIPTFAYVQSGMGSRSREQHVPSFSISA